MSHVGKINNDKNTKKYFAKKDKLQGKEYQKWCWYEIFGQSTEGEYNNQNSQRMIWQIFIYLQRHRRRIQNNVII